eukprot:jgi/Chlat1/8908/Chrsp92S08236
MAAGGGRNSGDGRAAAAAAVRDGMDKFRQGDVAASIAAFDLALQKDPSMKPLLWQRGLSLYYAERLSDAAEQFREDVAANPADAEEALWTFLDPRPVLRASLDSFQNASGAEAILKSAGSDKEGHDAFYSRLYAALYHEAYAEGEAARKEMLSAVATRYARASGDYMAALARVHCRLRGWSS